MRRALRLEHPDPRLAAAHGELPGESALADPGFSFDADDRPGTGSRVRQGFVEEPDLVPATHEGRQTTRPRALEARPDRAATQQLEDADRLSYAL